MKKYFPNNTFLFIFLLLFFIILPKNSIAQNSDIILTTNLKKHIEYLASDKLEGRGTGTKGEQKAAKYIAKQFKKIGLKGR